jgi:hypothetical protein
VMSISRLRLRHPFFTGVAEELIARDLMPGDNLQVGRGRGYEHVVSVTRHDGSRTICVFASGRRGTFQYKADLTIGSH